MTAEALAAALGGRRIGSGWVARCPTHKDKTPSLRIDEKDGRILVHCFGGCDQAVLIAELCRLGLWEPKKLPMAERILRATQRRYAETKAQENRELAAMLDPVKLRALERGDWQAWKRLGKVQYKLLSGGNRPSSDDRFCDEDTEQR